MQPLDALLRELQRRLKRLALLTGVAWTAATLLLLVLAICVADWVFHIDGIGVRRSLRGLLAMTATALLGVLVIRPWLRRYRDVDLALQVERIDPGWADALASSVEFAEADCPARIGAPALQRAVVARAQTRLARTDLTSLLDARMLRRGTIVAGLGLLLGVAALAADVESATLALQRLAFPRDAAAWPRTHTLVLLDELGNQIDAGREPLRRALGEPVTVYVADVSARLPDDVALYVQVGERLVRTEPLRRTSVDYFAGRRSDAYVATIPATASRMRFRAVGGDDRRMPWQQFVFSPRPALRELRATLAPPAYTGQPLHESRVESDQVEDFVGTHVRLDAQSNVPLASVVFRRDNQPPQPLELDESGSSFGVEFDIREAGRFHYWFEMQDRHGLAAIDPVRYEVRGIADREPIVAIERPPSDLTVTPQAELPLTVSARDDVGLTQVRLVLTLPPASAGEQYYPLPLEPGLREASLETTFSLAATGMTPGRQAVVRAEAADAFDLDGRHVGRSAARQLMLVSSAEKLQELLARQPGIAQSLERSLEIQTRALQQTRQLDLQWRTAGEFRPAEIDLFKRLAHDQQRIAAELFDERRGVEQRAAAILDELAWNKIEDRPTSNRLSQLGVRLQPLKADVLPRLEQTLHEAGKALDLPDPGRQGVDITQTLRSAAESQAVVASVLETLLDAFAQWQRHFDLAQTLAEIQDVQSGLYAETIEVGRQTLSRAGGGLTPQEQADLKRLAERQEDAAAQIDRFDGQLEGRDPAPADQGDEADAGAGAARELLREHGIANAMRQAAQRLVENRVTDAARTQAAVLQHLAELEAVLRTLAEPPPEALIKQFERAEQEARDFQERQADLRERTERFFTESETAPADDAAAAELRREQQALADDTSDWALRLQLRSGSDAASRATRAANAMRDAAAMLEGESAAEVAAHQQTALDELREVESELARAGAELAEQAADARWSELAALLDAFAERQQQQLEETVRLFELQRKDGNLGRSQLRTLQQLGEAQSHLSDDVVHIGEDLSGSPVLGEALRRIAATMQQAAALLGERRVDEPVRTAQQSAVIELRMLHGILQATPGDTSSGTSPGAEHVAEGPGQAGWLRAAQVRILLHLQTTLARQTAELRGSGGGDELAAEQRSALRQLAEQQSRLTELAAQLLQSASDKSPGAGTPDKETPRDVP